MPKIIIKAGRNKGVEYTIVSPRMVMGRRSHCDIQILESKSSREHAEILFDGQEMYIRDLGSRNGTRLNGSPITAKQPLRIGDQIAVGDTVLEVFDASLYKSDLEIPGYKILEGIGKGGMGTVYKAKHLPMDRIVALKVLNARFSHDQAFIDRFIREARAAGQLNHPNVIQVHDVSKVNDLYFFSMEFIDGPSVKEMLRKSGRLEVGRSLDIALQAAKALEYAHSKGIIHRDIKPDNLMLTRDGVLKIADLGIAKNFDDKEKDAKDSVLGTPHYMAPEQALGRTIDQRADIYSLGAAFYHMLTGQTPFTGDTAQSVIRAHLQEQLPAVQEYNPDVPDPVCFIVERMMAKSPDKRYENMTRVIADIEKARSGMGAEIERIQIEDSQIMQAVRPPEKRTWHKRKVAREQEEQEEKTDRHKTVGVSGVKVALITGGIVLGLGVVILIVLSSLQGNPPLPPPPPPDNGANNPPPLPPGPVEPAPVDPAVAAAEARQAALAALETEFQPKSATGDEDLEKRLIDFAAKNPDTAEADTARQLAEQSRQTRAALELLAIRRRNLTGQELIATLDGFLQKFPGVPDAPRAQKIRDDEATRLASAQTDAWSAAYRAMGDQYKNVPAENFDQRVKVLQDYLNTIKSQAGNPYIATVTKDIAEVKKEALNRLNNALETADNAIRFNQFTQAINEITKYKLRFKDTANMAKADAKITETIDKARGLFAAAKAKAVEHLRADIHSTSARRDLGDVVDKLKGVGTLGDDAEQAIKDLDCFDRLHALAIQPAVVDNVSDRALPTLLQVPGKKDLRLAGTTATQIQLGEGSSGVIIPKKWADLSLPERMTVYEYLLKSKEGPMAENIQADLDHARAFLGE